MDMAGVAMESAAGSMSKERSPRKRAVLLAGKAKWNAISFLALILPRASLSRSAKA